MTDRRFHRVSFSAPGVLVHHDMVYRVSLQNISLGGALISAGECIMVPPGETCRVTVLLDEDASPIVLQVRVVHSFFSMLGVQFMEAEENSQHRLLRLMESITPDREQLTREWEKLQSP